MRLLRNLMLLAALLALAGGAPPLKAQVGPSSFLPAAAPPGPPGLALARPAAGPALSQGSETCSQALDDPAVDREGASSPWVALRGGRAFDASQFSSAPRSLRPIEGAARRAAVGQRLSISAGSSSIYGSLLYRYGPGTAEAGDSLEVGLYRVGKIDAGGLLFAAAAFAPADAPGQGDGLWRRFDWELSDPAALAALRGLGEAELVVMMGSATGTVGQQLWLDDITLHTCLPATTISGRLIPTGAAGGLADAQVLLLRGDGSGSSLVASAMADDAGAYSFSGVPALASGESYQIWFVNAPQAVTRQSGRIGFWAGPTISALPAGSTLTGQDLPIGDVALGGPASYSAPAASDASPVTLSWTARGRSGERHQLCVYDPQRIDPATGLPPQVCGPLLDPAKDALQFRLAPASFAAVPGFGFQYGRSYRWYVVVYGAAPQTGRPTPYGYSFYERAISLARQTTAPPTAAPPPSAALPAAAAATADWTLMVYAAGDNALGDSLRAPTMARLGRQLDQLRGLAAAYPRLHIVTLSDSYGPTGAQLCYLRPVGAADCVERGEIDMAAPATLGGFIKTALARYPARHSMLVLAGPGHPVGGLAYDETTAGAPSLGPAELRAAFAAGGLGASGQKLDIVFYQAPLMGAIETVAATAPYGRYMLAATDLYWHMPLYHRLLPLLAGAQGARPDTVAKALVAAYDGAVVGAGGGLARSMAAYDLGRAAAVGAALDSLAGQLRSDLGGSGASLRQALASIRRAAQVYDSSGNGLLDRLAGGAAGPAAAEEDALVDLSGLAKSLEADPSLSAGLREAAGGLREALGGASPLVIASQQVAGVGAAGARIELGGSGGLAIFFPNGERLGGQATMVQLYLYGAAGPPRDGAWAAFLRAYLAEAVGAGPGGVTAGPLGGAQLRAPLGGLLRRDIPLPLVYR